MESDVVPGDLIDREEEMDGLESAFKESKEGGGSTIFLSGEAGIGKTRLIDELINKADSEGAKIIRGRCIPDSIKPFLPVKEALRNADLYHMIAEKPPPKVISAYLMTDSGLLVAKTEREESELDADIFASMLNAVQNFVKDSLSFMGGEEGSSLNSIVYGENDIIIQSMRKLSLALVIKGMSNEILIDDMRKKLKEIGSRFDDWKGKMKEVKEIEPIIKWFIDSGKYEGKFLVDDPKLKQENYFSNILLGLQRLSEEGPVIFFIDDLQWADHTTINLLHYLSRNKEDMNILILGTYRPEDIAKGVYDEDAPLLKVLNNMRTEGLCEEIQLERLGKDSTEEVIDSFLKNNDFDDAFIERIHDETDGNPLFIIELLNLLIDEGHISDEGGSRLIQPLEEVHFPSKIYDVIARRLDRLNSGEREILTYASVIGEEFESAVLERAMGMNRIKLLKRLNEIENTHNIIRSSGNKYSFDHSKIREILYEDINEELREEYHKLIAENYEQMYEDKGEKIYALATHWYRGGEYEKAFEYYQRAAEMAEDSFANKQAIDCYDHLLDMLPHLKGLDDKEKKEIDINHKKGDCLRTLGEWRSAEETYKKALQKAEEIGDKHKIGESKIKIGDIKKLEGEYDTALSLFEEASRIYGDIEDEEGYCDALGKVGSIYTNKSEYDKAMEYFEEMMKIADGLGDEQMISKVYGNMGSVYYGFGEAHKAMEYYEKKLEIQNDETDLLETGYTLVNMASIYTRLQEYENAMDCCDQVLEIVEKTGDKLMEQNVLGKLGIAYSEQGDFSKGLEYYKKKLSLSERMGDKRSVAYAANNIGELYKEKGDYEEALRYYQKDRDISKDLGDKKGYAITLGNMGSLYKLMGDFEKAEELYDDAIEIGRDQKTKDIISYFLSTKADLYFREGRIERSKELNDEAAKIAGEIKMSETLFNTDLLRAKIVSMEDEDEGIRLLKEMLDEDRNEPDRGKLLYELYNISGEDEYKTQALDFYRDMYEKNPSRRYEEIIKELEG